MIRLMFMLLLCLVACAPAAVLNAPMTTEDFIEDLNSYSNPIWEVSRTDAEAVVLEVMRAFDPALRDAYIVLISDSGLIVVEMRSQYLERQKVLVLLAFQDRNAVLGVYDLNNKSGEFVPRSLAVRLEVEIVGAMDARFQRGKL